jgi:predicted transcriptional regulator
MHKQIIKARDVMRVDFIEIDGKATVADAIRMFKKNELRLLIVKKRDESDAYGVVLLSDIVKKVLAKDRAVERVNLYEIMSKPAIFVEPDLDVRYCARLFSKFPFSNTLVVEAGKVIGVVGYRELLVPWAESEN